jgi:hypothetical protein
MIGDVADGAAGCVAFFGVAFVVTACWCTSSRTRSA